MNTRRDGSGKIGVHTVVDSDIEEVTLFEDARKYLELQKQYRNYVRMGLAAYGAAVLATTLIMLVLSIPIGIAVLILAMALTLAVIAAGVLVERRWTRIHKVKREWWNGVKTSVNKRHVEADKKANAVRGLIRKGVGIDPQMSKDLGASAAAKEVYDTVRSLRL
jgi:hypothetical protein